MSIMKETYRRVNLAMFNRVTETGFDMEFMDNSAFIYSSPYIVNNGIFADAPMEKQKAYLHEMRDAVTREADVDVVRTGMKIIKILRQISVTTLLVETGGRFIYPLGDLRLANGKEVPNVTVIPDEGEPYIQGTGETFNNDNVEIWMTTLLMCVRRRGIRRVSDIMRDILVDFVQIGRMKTADVFIKDPKWARSGMAVTLDGYPSPYFPRIRGINNIFYDPPSLNDFIMPHNCHSPSDYIDNIVNCVEKGAITSATDTPHLLMYENALDNYIKKTIKAKTSVCPGRWYKPSVPDNYILETYTKFVLWTS